MDDTFKPTKKKLLATLAFLSCIIVSLWLGGKIDSIMNTQVYEVMSLSSESGQATNKVDEGAKVLESVAASVNEEQKAKVKEIYYQYFAIKWLAYTVVSYLFACLLFKRIGIKETA